jgi:hypothetical protein
MSTSYTNNLKLGKPAAGDTGWGNTLNAEVTDMVEEAIAGMRTINTWSSATPAVHTLTTANGTTSEARAAILQLKDTTSDIGSIAQLIVPNVSKLYCIINDTGHPVTVKTAAGTGVSVPTGKQFNVVCDGTNVVEQVNYQGAAEVNTLTTSGLATLYSLKVSNSGATVTQIADEDNMSSNSDTKLATQQSIKAYVDNNSTYHRQANYFAWDVPTFNQSTNVTSATPKFYVADGDTATLVEFELLRPSPATASRHKIDITLMGDKDFPNPGGQNFSTGFQQYCDIIYFIERKSKLATGVSIGINTVAQDQLGAGNSHFYKIYVNGDVTSELDNFSWIAKTASPASNAKYQVMSYEYEVAGNRTGIVFNGNSSSATPFTSTNNFVFVSNTGFTAVDSWHTATHDTAYNSGYPFYTGSMGEYFAAYSGNEFQRKYRLKDVLPPVVVKPESAGTIEMRIQVTCGVLSTNGEYFFEQATIDQTTIGRD